MAGSSTAETADASRAAPRLDGRSERWREHRIHRREEIVDATIRALNEFGPDVRMEQIAEVAGTAKPKLYRHFADRAELVEAVGSKVAESILLRLAEAVDPALSLRAGLTRSLEAYLSYVEENPNVIRFLMENVNPGDTRANPIVENARMIARLFVALASADLAAIDAPTDLAEPMAHALIGSVLGATDWWIITEPERRMSRQRLVDHLVLVLIAAIDAMLTAWGLDFDSDAPNLGSMLEGLPTPTPTRSG
jgi:AcrR family transcriptional regulator